MEDDEIDWSQCDLVDSVPGRMSGKPCLKGTRMPADAIVENYDAGVDPEEIAEQFQIPLSAVIGILQFARGAKPEALPDP
jgi:uncharacterized protein (DUF433 family)